MNKILGKDEKKFILSELKEELDFKSIDYSDVDYSEVEYILKKSP